MQIRLDDKGNTHLPDAVHRRVACEEDVRVLMEVAQRKRHVAFTSMNARSSRSHAVFSLFLTGRNAQEGTTLKGSLNLVDLAGSERLDRRYHHYTTSSSFASCSHAEGARLKETQAINKSLACLTDVFMALSRKQAHTPYRNSKLTFLLHKCFSQHGKTLMFVNLSPTLASAPETLCSLRFAQLVSQVKSCIHPHISIPVHARRSSWVAP